MLPTTVIDATYDRAVRFAREYHGEVPSRLHSRDLDQGGGPAWHPRFAAWMTRSTRPPMDGAEPDRMRVTRAMRMLRKVAPREADVVYRVIVLSHSAEQIQGWLNDRSIAGGHADRYSLKDAVVLIVSGLDKIHTWY